MFSKGHLVVFKTGKNWFIYTVDEINDSLVILKSEINSIRMNVSVEQIREADDLEILLGRRIQK